MLETIPCNGMHLALVWVIQDSHGAWELVKNDFPGWPK
jgi:hypothetical protein